MFYESSITPEMAATLHILHFADKHSD